jgi:hypothetical protein
MRTSRGILKVVRILKIYVHVYYAGSARIDSKNVAAENIFCGKDGAG